MVHASDALADRADEGDGGDTSPASTVVTELVSCERRDFQR